MQLKIYLKIIKIRRELELLKLSNKT